MKSVKRVKKDLDAAIEDKQTEGYKLKSQTDNQAYMKKNNYGSLFWHLIIFIFFGWWTFLVANLIYLIYSYVSKSDELYIKIGKLN